MPSVILAGTTTGTALSLTSDTSGELQIRTNNGSTTAMTLTTAGLVGIGTNSPAAVGSRTTLNIKGSAGSALRLSDDTGNAFFDYTDGTGVRISVNAAEPLSLQTNSQERMRIDSAGNVGIGTASPNSLLNVSAASNAIIELTATSGGPFRHYLRTAGDDLQIRASAGVMGFYTGNADGLSSTERMRIDSSGNLLVGTTSAISSGHSIVNLGTSRQALTVKGDTDASYTLGVWSATTSGDNLFTYFATEASITVRGAVTYNRAGGLTVYGTTSDYRSKDIISPVLNSGEVIDSVPVYMGKMKGATQARPMFIAHETPDYAHTGEKDAVDKDGNPVYQQMDASSLVPVLWAEIQSLRKRIAALEFK